MRYPRPAILDEIAARGARHVVIEASAGTGKTFTLEHAVVDLVLEGNPIGRVLAVTFTERAAAELKERVREVLQRILAAAPPSSPPASSWLIDDAARGRLRQALLDFDDAAIFTIHGFCQRVLTEHAFLVDRLLEQTLVDANAAFGDGFRHVLRADLATRQRSELRAWLDHADVETLEKLLFDVDARHAERLRPELQPEPLRAALEALAASRTAGLKPAQRALQQALTVHVARRKASSNHLETVVDAAAAWLDSASDSSQALLALSVNRELDRPLAYLHDNAPELIKKVPVAAPLLEHAVAVHRWRVPIAAAAAQLFLPQVQARVAAEKRRLGQYDFDDMLAIVRDAVTTSPVADALVAALRRRYGHALIDEFQDTNDDQWATFRRVFVEAPAPHALWVIGDPKQAIYGFRGADVFTYLRATRELLGAPAPDAATAPAPDEPPARPPFPLVHNYRSTERMVDAFNVIFDTPATDGDAPFFAGEITYPRAACGQRERFARDAAGQPVAPVHLFHFVRDPGLVFRAAPLRELFARRIAEEARRLVSDGLIVGGAGKASRRIEYRDVFVLTRTTKEALQVSRHLRALGVPFAFYKQEGLLQTLEADDVHAVLCAVLDPHDRARRFRAWVTPFFGLSLDELEECRDVPGDHPLVARLLAWSRLAERRAYGALFAAMLEDSGLVRRELLLRASERELTNYLHLLERLHETAARERLELHELVRELGAWIHEERAPEGEDPNVQRLESEAAAVQLMTMHKAKGLEAEVVFVFGGLSNLGGRELNVYHDADGVGMVRAEKPEDEQGVVVYHDPRTLRRIVHVGPLTREVAERVRVEQDAEERRLVYVALTRARSRLYLPSFGRHAGTDRAGKARDVWDFPHLGGCMLPLAARLAALMPGALDARLFEVEVLTPALVPTAAPPGAAPDVAAAIGAWAPPDALLEPLDASLAQEAEEHEHRRGDPRHAPLVITSYTGMKRASDARELARASASPAAAPPAAAPALAPATPPAFAEPDLLPGGADMGNCVHELLEHVDLAQVLAAGAAAAWAARPEVQELTRRAAVKSGVPTRHGELVAALAHRALTTPLSLAHGVLLPGVASLGAQALRELEFTYPIPERDHPPLLPPPGAELAVERGWIRGYMDLVFRHDGRGYVADWKTNRLADYAPARLRELVAADYDLQRKIYALALSKMLGVTTPEEHEARFGGVLFLFLRGLRPPATPGVEGDAPGVVFDRPDFEALQRFERELRDFPAYRHGWDPAWTEA